MSACLTELAADDDVDLESRQEREVLVCQQLEDVLSKVEAHSSVGDWSSAVLLMLTLVKHFGLASGSNPGLAASGPIRGFLHKMRVAWQGVLSADDGGDHSNLPPRVEVADAMVEWDPTVEYRVPDDWGVLLNERREVYFQSHPVEHAVVEVLELWEKLRGHTIEAMMRRCGDLEDLDELMQVSSDNVAILQAEAERLVMRANAHSLAARIRCKLAAIVVVNAKIRAVFNNVQAIAAPGCSLVALAGPSAEL